jgi:hypothetical protein
MVLIHGPAGRLRHLARRLQGAGFPGRRERGTAAPGGIQLVAGAREGAYINVL